MSSRFWASSEDVSSDSVDLSHSTQERGLQSGSRDHSTNQFGASTGGQDGNIVNKNTALVPRDTANNAVMPDSQPYQRANLFYLAMIEGRCKTQAASVINSSREVDEKVGEDHPEVLEVSRHMFNEVRRELVKVGMLSEEFATGDQPQLHTYLNSFDNILDNIATQQGHSISGLHEQAVSDSSLPQALTTNTSFHNLPDSLIPRAHQLAGRPPPTSHFSNLKLLGNSTSIFDPSIINASGALIPGNLFVTPNNFPMGPTSSFQTLLRNVFPGEDHSKHIVSTDASHYAANFIQLSKLGAGGFGAVYKVRNKFDKGVYAIKKIVVRREELQNLYDNNNIRELASLIKEVQALAKLQHHNIVCYQHFWMEARPLDENTSSGNSDEEDTEETSEGRTLESLSLASLSLTNEFSLKRDMRVQRRRASSCISAEIAADIDAGHILFSDEISETETKAEVSKDTKHESEESDQEDENTQDDDDDSDEEEDTEEIVRYDGQIVRSPKKNLKHAEFDLVLYIKMAAYPLSLQDYIRQHTDKSKSVEVPDIQHCYHVGPTIKLLLSILDGIEYIHRKNVVHRDLKPGNILLQILEPSDKPTSDYVNTSECSGCPPSSSGTLSTWISPRIGDFGLVHDLSSSPPMSSADRSTSLSGSISTAPGTATYLPLNLRKSSRICAKLDVYSLGIIAFEMSYQFGTSTERVIVLENLKRSGEVPRDFEKHPLKECILGMVKENIGERWDCAAVRGYLEGVLGEL